MGEPKNQKVRLQWQDGVGNMQIFGEEESQTKTNIRWVVMLCWVLGVTLGVGLCWPGWTLGTFCLLGILYRVVKK